MKKDRNKKTMGNLLEQIVAELHNYPDVRIEKKAFIKPLNGNGKAREFDILLRQSIAGYDVIIPIECKNWPNRKIEAPDIDSYVGKLQSVGLPLNPAIFITSGKYTKGAIERAIQAGIKTLTLEGLNKEGLEPIILSAFENLCFEACEIIKFSMRLTDPMEQPDENLNLYSTDGVLLGFIADLIWNSWQMGLFKKNIGVFTLNFSKKFKALCKSGNLIDVDNLEINLQVFKFVLTKNINSNLVLLKDRNNIPIKFKFSKVSNDNSRSIPIYRFDSEEALKEYEKKQSGIRIKYESRLSRILFGTAYWPPSEEFVKKVNENSSDLTKTIYEPKHIIESINDRLDAGWLKFYNEYFRNLNPHFTIEN